MDSGQFFWALLNRLTQDRRSQLLFLSQQEARIYHHSGRAMALYLGDGAESDAVDIWLDKIAEKFQGTVLDVLVVSENAEMRSLLQSQKHQTQFSPYSSLQQWSARDGLWTSPNFIANSPLSSEIKQLMTKGTLDIDVFTIKASLLKKAEDDARAIREISRFQDFLGNRTYGMTLILTCLIGVVFVLEELWGGSTFTPTLIRMGGNNRERVLDGEVWRLCTSVFLHGGYVHVFLNGYVLVALGSFLNRVFGGVRFLLIFLVSGIFGSLASVMWGHAAISVGASGALWGLFGLSAALIVRPSPFLPETVRIRLRRITIINLVLNLGVSFLPMVDIWAHLGGGVAGFLVGFLLIQTERQRALWSSPKNNLEPVWSRVKASLANPVTVICFGGIIASFAAQFQTAHPWWLVKGFNLRDTHLQGTDLSIGVPSMIQERQRSVNNRQHNFAFGELPYDPLQMNVIVIPVDLNEESDEDAVVDLLLNTLEEIYGSENIPMQTPPAKTRIDGVLTLFSSYEVRSGTRLFVWVQVRGNQLVIVRAIILPKSPAPVVDHLEDIIRSLKTSHSLISRKEGKWDIRSNDAGVT